MEKLPEEMIRLIWKFEGRYTNAMKHIFDFLTSAMFRKMISPYSQVTYDSLIKRREWHSWVYTNNDDAYIKEINIRVKKYKKRMELETGQIIGITDKHPGRIKSFIFKDCLAKYKILCTAKHYYKKEIIHEGIVYKTAERYPTLIPIYDYEKKPIKVKAKCGIEVLNKRWLFNAKKNEAAYIKYYMAI